MNQLFRPLVNGSRSPFLLEDYRLGFVQRGYMHGILNLQEYRAEAGSMMMVAPGSIAEPLDMSDDFTVMGIGIPADMFHIAHSGKLPDIFNGQMKHAIQRADEEQVRTLCHLFQLMWELVNSLVSETGSGDGGHKELLGHCVIHRMLTTITSYYDYCFARPQSRMGGTRSANDIFDRFIYLVNSHCRDHRQLAFYADKICITERYLSTVVRQTSGVTAKEWIDRAVITAAKVMLRHGNLQVAQIAERLHFPNASFFCKYFKRLEGCTPQKFRLKGK